MGHLLVTLVMVVSVVMMFAMDTFKEEHLDGNYCTGTATASRPYRHLAPYTMWITLPFSCLVLSSMNLFKG